MRLKLLKTKTGLLITIVITLLLVEGCANKGNQLRQQSAPVPQQSAPVPQQSSPILQQNQSQGNRVDIAQKAADKVVSVPGVRQANVLVTQSNAYVAAVLTDTNAQLSREMENKIAEQVRSTDPNIQNVYVSTNPDFVNRVNAYVKDIQEGRPVTGFIEQFNELIKRIFPKAR